MAFSKAQAEVDGHGGTSVTVTFGSTPAANDLIVACIGAAFGSGAASTTMSGTVVNSWTSAVEAGSGGATLSGIWFGYASGTNASGTYTNGKMGTTSSDMVLSDWSGVKSASPLDVTTAASGFPTQTMGSTTTDAGDLVIAAACSGNALGGKPGSVNNGFTILGTPSSGIILACFKIETATENPSVTWTGITGFSGVAVMASFLPAPTIPAMEWYRGVNQPSTHYTEGRSNY